MSKRIIDFCLNSLLIIIFIYIFLYSNTVKITIIYGINIWINNLIPTLFPFLLISKLLIYYNIIEHLNKIFGYFIEKIYKVSKNSSFIVIISMFTGFPTGSIYIKEMLENNYITIEEANKLITFTSFANPLFVISVIGETLLNNKEIGIFIFIIHLITGLSVGLLFKCDKKSINIVNNNSLKDSFITILMKSINTSFITLVNMLGIIIFFLIIISLINTIIPNNIFTIILNGIIEITSGITYLTKSKLNLKLVSSLIGAFISFNGISVHFQIKSIIDNTHIKYVYFLFARILHSLLCFVFIFILFDLLF